MTAPQIDAKCTACKFQFPLPSTPKRSFLGFQKLVCPACGASILYPLTTGYRVTYWVVFTGMMLSIVGAYAEGGIGVPGGIGLAVIAALFKDYLLRRQVKRLSSGQLPQSAVDR